MEALAKVTVIFTLALALSLLIERFLEVLKSITDLLDSRYDWYKFWNRRTASLRDKLEHRLNVFEYVRPETAASVLNRAKSIFLKTPDKEITNAPVISGDLVRAFYIKVIFKVVAIALGIGLAFWFNVDLVAIWTDAKDPNKPPSFIDIDIRSETLRIIFTGVALGLGSGPVHKIIVAIEDRRKQREEGSVA